MKNKFFLNAYRALIFIMTFAFLSCRHDSKLDNALRINIEPDKTRNFNISELFSSVDLIELRSDSNVVFVKPVKLNVYNGLYYLHSNDMIVVFDSIGNNVLLFNNKGLGPHEYINISDMIVENENIIINDREGQKLLFYDLNGNFIESFKHGLLAYNFTKVGDEVFLNSGNLMNASSAYKVNLYDLKSEKMRSGFIKQEIGLDYLSIMEYTNFSLLGDTLSYSQSFSNTIYRLKDNGEVIPRVEVDFGKHNLPDEFLHENKSLRAFYENFTKSDFASRIDGYYENEKMIFFMYSYQDKKPFVFYDKKKQKVYNFDRFTDDLLFSGIVQTTSYNLLPLLMDEKFMYVSIDAHRFIELYEELIKKYSNDEIWSQLPNIQQLEKIYKSIDEESNPIILRYRFK